jgi:1,4-alpha-glucan branching enzyme
MKDSTATPRKSTRKTSSKKVRFELVTEPGREVFVAGSFNDWATNQQPLKPHAKSGAYVATMQLPAGTHEYKFVVDGNWQIDPSNPCVSPNGLNNILQV